MRLCSGRFTGPSGTAGSSVLGKVTRVKGYSAAACRGRDAVQTQAALQPELQDDRKIESMHPAGTAGYSV